MRAMPSAEEQRWISAMVIGLSIVIAAALGVVIATVGAIYAIGIILVLGIAALAIARIEWVMLGAIFARSFVNVLPTSFVVIAGTRSRGLDLGAVIVLSVAVFGIAYILIQRVDVFRFPLTAPLLLFISAGTLSLVESSDRLLTLDNIIKLLSYFALFAVFATIVRRRTQVVRTVVILVAVGLLITGFGLSDVGRNPDTLEFQQLTGLPRLEGVFQSGLGFGTALVIPLVLSLTMLLEARRAAGRIRWGLATAILAGGFVLSLARMPWAAFFVSVGILGLLRYRKLPLAFLAAVVVLVLTVPGVVIRVKQLADPEAQRGYDLLGRLGKWTSGLEVFRQSPVIGNGFGAGEREAVIQATEGKNPGMLHSDYIRVLTDTGMVGFLAFLWLLLAHYRVGISAFRSVQTPLYRGLAAAFLAIWAGFLFIRATGNIATSMPVNFAFYALAGVVWALPAVERAEASAGEEGLDG